MTTIATPGRTSGERRAARRAFHFQMSAQYLLTAATSVVAALPLALVVARMPLALIGWIYATAWGVIVVPSMGAYSGLLYDAVLMALNRPPLFLPTALANARRLEREHRRALTPLRWIAAVANWINPFSNLVGAAILTVLRLRPRLAHHVMEQAAALVKEFDRATAAVAREPMAEMAQPVINQVEREFDGELQAC